MVPIPSGIRGFSSIQARPGGSLTLGWVPRSVPLRAYVPLQIPQASGLKPHAFLPPPKHNQRAAQCKAATLRIIHPDTFSAPVAAPTKIAKSFTAACLRLSIPLGTSQQLINLLIKCTGLVV